MSAAARSCGGVDGVPKTGERSASLRRARTKPEKWSELQNLFPLAFVGKFVTAAAAVLNFFSCFHALANSLHSKRSRPPRPPTSAAILLPLGDVEDGD